MHADPTLGSKHQAVLKNITVAYLDGESQISVKCNRQRGWSLVERLPDSNP
jgi:hypothetical protein